MTPTHRAVLHDEVEREILDEEIDLVLHALAVERVQHRVAGAVGGGAGALCDALAVIRSHAAEGALIDLAFLGAREGHAEMLEFVDRFRRIAAEIFDGVLIAQPVRTLDGVVHVPAPVVLAHIAERGGDAALRRDRVAARRKHLGDAGGLEASRCAFQRGAQSGAAGADDDDIECVIDDRVGGHLERSRNAKKGKYRRRADGDGEARASAAENSFGPLPWT